MQKLHWKQILYVPPAIRWVLFAAAVMLGLRFCVSSSKPSKPAKPRVEEVSISGWVSMDEPLKAAFKDAEKAAGDYAERAVKEWINELKHRTESDFLPWYFNYWNQQAIGLQTAGWVIAATPAAQTVLGKQPSVEARLEKMIGDAFMIRVIQPPAAQQRIDAITRETVKTYLHTLSGSLQAQKAAYKVKPQEWNRFLHGVDELIAAVEGNRQVPLTIKVMTAGSSVAVGKVVQAVVVRFQKQTMRRVYEEGMEYGARHGGRLACRGLGWIAFFAVSGWDLYDHHRTVSQNTPLMRGIIFGSLDQLEKQVMNDSECGIHAVLEEVRLALVSGIKP